MVPGFRGSAPSGPSHLIHQMRAFAPQPPAASVAELRTAAGDVLPQLLAYGVVERRGLVLVELLLVDLRGPGAGVLAAAAQPALVVLRRREHRPVEARA